MRGLTWLVQGLALGVLLPGCGKCDCSQQAKTPAEVMQEEEAVPGEEAAPSEAKAEPAPSYDEVEQKPVAAAEPAPAADKPKSDLPEPKFTPGMSVGEAIAAVPKGWEFEGIEPDVLGRPLADLKLYEPCKLTPAQHFKMKVAVWDGRAVGIDVNSANKRLADCIKDQVSKVQWDEKVKAINTVDYAY